MLSIIQHKGISNALDAVSASDVQYSPNPHNANVNSFNSVVPPVHNKWNQLGHGHCIASTVHVSYHHKLVLLVVLQFSCILLVVINVLLE